MQTHLFVFRSRMPASAEALYRWHTQPDSFERLLPPGDRTRVIARSWDASRPGLPEGGEMTLRVPLGPFGLRWIARLYDCVEGERFRDIQVAGPFAYWQHSHLMHVVDSSTSDLEDRVVYALPGGPLGHVFGGPFVRRRLQRLFEHRHAVIRGELARAAAA